MSHFDHKLFYRRNLSHIQPPGATFFVTFNLAGSLPRAVLQQWTAEKRQLEAEKSHLLKSQGASHFEAVGDITSEQKQEHLEWNRRWFRKFETALDNAQSGPLWLKDERIVKEVAESLRYRDGKVYRLDAYCIMANHVHAVFAPLAIQPSGEAQTNRLWYNTLASIMQSLKGYTARKANRLLGRNDAFWHHESYDHSVRNTSEWQRIVTYVLNNPVKVGLIKDWEKWQWSYCRGFHGTANCLFAITIKQIVIQKRDRLTASVAFSYRKLFVCDHNLTDCGTEVRRVLGRSGCRRRICRQRYLFLPSAGGQYVPPHAKDGDFEVVT